jgi:hypothetical protein
MGLCKLLNNRCLERLGVQKVAKLGYSGEKMTSLISNLIQNNERLKILLTGECIGAMCVNEAMKMIDKNNRVYAIHSECPFWYHKRLEKKRTLILKNNGNDGDFIYEGSLVTTIKQLKGIIVGEHGHFYDWRYKKVKEKITSFLKNI